jgi:RNA polymerase sigma-70 factor (ECF subfamily)
MTASQPQLIESTSTRPGHVREREWLARIRAGDERAFEELYNAYKNHLAPFINSLVRSREVTEDLMQDLFLRIWEQRDMWECPGPLGAYLFRAARNRAINYIRHQQVDAAFRESTSREELAAGSSVAPAASDASVGALDLARAIDCAIEQLPPRCREVFVLNRRHYLSYAEVAAVMQLSVKTVEVQMGRALASLRTQLSEWLT